MKVRLHIGAHRTGTTGLQMQLRRAAPTLLKTHDLLYLGPKEIRSERRGKGGGPDGGTTPEARIQHAIAMTNPATLVYSEENSLGSMGALFKKGSFYKAPTKRVAMTLACLPKPEKLTILMAIRDYSGYFASAYAQMLKRGQLPPFQDFKPDLLALPRRWSDVIAELRGRFGEAEIVVWTFEAAMHRTHDVSELVCGTPVPQATGNRMQHNPGPSDRAIRLLTQMPDDLGVKARAAIATQYPAARYGAFQPWLEAEKAYLADVYAQEIDQLRNHKDPMIRFVDLDVAAKGLAHG